MRFSWKGKLWLLFFPVLLSSCTTVLKIFYRVNVNHKTPAKAFIYPVFNACDSLRGELNPARSCYDVYFYNLSVKFNLEQKSIEGSNEFYITATEPFDSLQIDLYKNLRIDSIIFDKKALLFNRKCNAVFVHFPSKIDSGEKKIFTVYYHGSPVIAKYPPWEGGFVWKKDKNKNPWAGVACEVDGASLWWPVKDHLTDEPDSMAMHYTVPQGLKCVANGILTDTITNNGKTTFDWMVHYPINTYDVTFYIGTFENFDISCTSDFEPYKLSFYVLPYNLDTAKQHFLQVPAIVKFFEKKFGPYPWPKDGFKLVESPFEGMEHQTAIAYGNGYKNHYNYGFDYIILHETAHEWWGNCVTANDYSDVWIHEGFATYAEALYVENYFGYETYQNYLRFYAMLIKNKRPVVGPSNVNYWDYKDGDVYFKGALMLHTLRNTLRNDSLFFGIVQDFYKKYFRKITTTKDFVELVNEKTHQDFTPFFNQYLYSRVCPELEWEFFYDAEKEKNMIYYRWTNAVEDFTIPIKLKTGDRTFIIRPTNKLQKSELPFDKTILLNTEESYISSKRTNKF